MKNIIIILIIFFSSCISVQQPIDMNKIKKYDKIFFITGDSRKGDFNNELQKTELINNDGIKYTLSKFNKIDAILMTGDYVGSGKKTNQWKEWIESEKISFQYPLYPCIGNHDDERFNCGLLPKYECYQLHYKKSNYYKTFKFPDWYSVDIDNIHIISISSNYDDKDEKRIDRKQKEWLINDLQKNTNSIIIVLYHSPAYSSYTWFKNGHGSDLHMRNTYSNIFEKYNVDLVINGHTHWYERTEPILNGKYNKKGLTRITVGGGGALLTPTSWLPSDKVHDDNGKNISVINKSFYGYVIIAIKDNIIYGWAIRYINHAVIDSFQIICKNKKIMK